MKKVSIIIPIKISNNNTYLLNRLKIVLNSFKADKFNIYIELVIVDSSLGSYQNKLKTLINTFLNTKYLHFDIKNIYSASKARNYGVQKANGEYVLFYDVDLLVDDSFLKNILNDIKKIKQNQKLFFIYPCLYLSEKFTKKIIEENNINFNQIKDNYLKGFNDEVLYLAVNTSTILVNKNHFIKIGMYNEHFKGHGYEDFELIHRLYLSYSNHKIEDDYLLDFKIGFPAKYQGFRKYFSYLSLPNFFRDVYTIHLWHPRPLTQKYYKVRKKNQDYFLQQLKNDLKNYKYNNNETLIEFDIFIQKLLINLDLDIYCGLYKYHHSVKKQKNSIKRKIRKLFINPIGFFKDINLKG